MTIEKIDPDKLDEFTRAYIECALFTATDNDGCVLIGRSPDISQECLKQIVEDCETFQKENAKDILTWETSIPGATDTAEEIAGIDFWLTRNGHGAGFWDEDWKEEVGKRLTEASKVWGEVNLYVGDDGLIYC